MKSAANHKHLDTLMDLVPFVGFEKFNNGFMNHDESHLKKLFW